MIPKIFHQVWLGDSSIPKEYIEYTESFKRLHPNWEYKFWNEQTLKNSYCWPLITKAVKYSSQSNIARLYIILNYGGIYSDFDVEWIQNIDHLLQHSAFAAIEPHKTKWYGNGIFGAEPNHPWIKHQYDLLPNYIYKNPPWGPKLMTLAKQKYPKLVTDIQTNLFYPYPCCKKPDSIFTNSYAVHHWTRSWKDK